MSGQIIEPLPRTTLIQRERHDFQEPRIGQGKSAFLLQFTSGYKTNSTARVYSQIPESTCQLQYTVHRGKESQLTVGNLDFVRITPANYVPKHKIFQKWYYMERMKILLTANYFTWRGSSSVLIQGQSSYYSRQDCCLDLAPSQEHSCNFELVPGDLWFNFRACPCCPLVGFAYRSLSHLVKVVARISSQQAEGPPHPFIMFCDQSTFQFYSEYHKPVRVIFHWSAPPSLFLFAIYIWLP